MSGNFTVPNTGMPPLHSSMALDDDGNDGHVEDSNQSAVIKPKGGLSDAAAGDEDDPWAV